MTRVSVCIPCHNAAAYVDAALHSVLNQTWQEIEVIVVNDGSTDHSAEILDRFQDRRVKVIDHQCGSAAKARNRAQIEATGDYIKFFDADDLLSPDHIRLQLNRLMRRTDAVATASWGRFYDDDSATFVESPEKVWRDMESTEWLISAWECARPMMQPGLFLIPRQVIEEAGTWNEELTLIDDFEFFARVLSHSQEVLFTPGATLYYRSGNEGSLSGRKSREAVLSAYHSLNKGTGHLLKIRSDRAARLSCANMLQDFIYTYYPDHADLRKAMEKRINELGGSNLKPEGPPGFHQLRKVFGWKAAKIVQNLMCK